MLKLTLIKINKCSKLVKFTDEIRSFIITAFSNLHLGHQMFKSELKIKIN